MASGWIVSCCIRHILPECSRGVRMSTWWRSDLHVGHHVDWIYFTSSGGSSWKELTRCQRHLQTVYKPMLPNRTGCSSIGVCHTRHGTILWRTSGTASLPHSIQPESSNFVRQRRIFHLPRATFEPDAFSRRAAMVAQYCTSCCVSICPPWPLTCLRIS